MPEAPETAPRDAFHAAMDAASVGALWERAERGNRPPEAPHIWRWRTMDPLIEQAIAATNMDNAERRVLVLRNPAYAAEGLDCASPNLSVNLQVLMPGERARPHRHTMNALRFVLEGDGAVTVVDGKPCPMERGDMILTPGWTWHEHVHEGTERSVWVDALDVPVHLYHRTDLFEPGPAHDVPELPPDAAFESPGLMPAARLDHLPYSPMFRYAWRSAVRALDAMSPAADGSRLLRYTNPVDGGPAVTNIDCYLLGLAGGAATRKVRSTANAVAVVVEGEGRTTVSDETMDWGPNDVFTVPHGQWISHRASGAGARLFLITDREMFDRLGLLREEFQD